MKKPRVNDCHPDRKHYAKGQCASCYMKAPHRLAYRKRWRETSPKYKEIQDRYYAKRTETASWRNGWLNRKFGITEDEYNEMLSHQNRQCLLCGTEPTNRRLAVDHNHITNKVRGLLCLPCNRVLGYVENTEWINKATEYLRSHSCQ